MVSSKMQFSLAVQYFVLILTWLWTRCFVLISTEERGEVDHVLQAAVNIQNLIRTSLGFRNYRILIGAPRNPWWTREFLFILKTQGGSSARRGLHSVLLIRDVTRVCPVSPAGKSNFGVVERPKPLLSAVFELKSTAGLLTTVS